MVRRRACAVSNHEADHVSSFETRRRRRSSSDERNCARAGMRVTLVIEHRRRNEAAELTLDQCCEFERRAIFQPGAEDLYADPQSLRPTADRYGCRRQTGL